MRMFNSAQKLQERDHRDTNSEERQFSIIQEYNISIAKLQNTWFNDKEIEWTSLGMNMVHSSDNSCEACCNFQSIFLESQLMTRFMYPNPKLIF